MKKNKNTFNRLVIGFIAALLFATTGVHAAQTTRVSVSSAGAQADCEGIGTYFCNYTDAISADGRYVVFSSYAGGLVAGYGSLYVRDRVTGKTTRVNGVSNNVFESFDTSAISADGRYIVFSSLANNLVAGDTNESMDIFVRDRVTGTTSRVSVSSKGMQGNDYSFKPAISADGRYVAFRSWADTLVDDDGDTNGNTDVFVRDRMTGKTKRVNISSTGEQGNGNGNDEDDYFNDFRSHIAISADGRYVAFSTNASNLVTGDTNGIDDVFVRDCVNHTTTRVSVGLAGLQGNSYSREPAISADGRYVTFESAANNLIARDTNRNWDVFVRDRKLNTTTRVSVSSAGTQANYGGWASAISADGRYVAFSSYAKNLVAGGMNGFTDVFVRDLATGTTTTTSVSSAGVQGNSGSGYWGWKAISADGRFVAFDSDAFNLVAGDTNDAPDIFVRDRLLNTIYVADLQATVAAKPASVKKGQTASYRLMVKNNGPDSASNVALTDIVSNGTVLSITPCQGTYSLAAISVCRLGTLTAGASVSVAVNIRAKACSLTQQISVSATPKDNAPSNNTVKISTPVIIP